MTNPSLSGRGSALKPRAAARRPPRRGRTAWRRTERWMDSGAARPPPHLARRRTDRAAPRSAWSTSAPTPSASWSSRGVARNPLAIFNEKAVLGLGRGLQQTGRLNDGRGRRRR